MAEEKVKHSWNINIRDITPEQARRLDEYVRAVQRRAIAFGPWMSGSISDAPERVKDEQVEFVTGEPTRRIVVDKRVTRIRFEKESEDEVQIVIEKKDL